MKHLLIFAALTAGAAQADSSCPQSALHAAGQPVRSAYGDCWQTTYRPRPLTAEVRFEFDGAQLSADGRKVLDDLAQRFIQSELRSVVATAYADRLGSEEHNLHLSARRAHAVYEYLVGKGIPESVIQLDVAGTARPVARCDDLGEENRRNAKLVACLQPDRRVQVEAASK